MFQRRGDRPGPHRGGDVGIVLQIITRVEIKQAGPVFVLAVQIVMDEAGTNLARLHGGGNVGIFLEVPGLIPIG